MSATRCRMLPAKKFLPMNQLRSRLRTLPRYRSRATRSMRWSARLGSCFDKETAFREAYRTLRRGGRYLFRVWNSERYNPFASLSFEVLKQFFPVDTPRFLFDPAACR